VGGVVGGGGWIGRHLNSVCFLLRVCGLITRLNVGEERLSVGGRWWGYGEVGGVGRVAKEGGYVVLFRGIGLLPLVHWGTEGIRADPKGWGGMDGGGEGEGVGGCWLVRGCWAS